MSGLTALRVYAQKAPSELPASILFSHTDRSLTVLDKFPKAKFHFLVLPRVHDKSPATLADLYSLKTLLKSTGLDKEMAKEIILGLKEDAVQVKTEIEKEMDRMYGFTWPTWIGFHAVPSMQHLHVHVISGDLCSDSLKVKKHYNSFHPKLGFFLHIDEVLSWFDAEPSYYNTMVKLEEKQYESLLKEDLACFHCNHVSKNMPQLKQHIEEEWNKLAERERTRADRKRKLEERKDRKKTEELAEGEEQEEEEVLAKKAKIDED